MKKLPFPAMQHTAYGIHHQRTYDLHPSHPTSPMRFLLYVFFSLLDISFPWPPLESYSVPTMIATPAKACLPPFLSIYGIETPGAQDTKYTCLPTYLPRQLPLLISMTEQVNAPAPPKNWIRSPPVNSCLEPRGQIERESPVVLLSILSAHTDTHKQHAWIP